MRKILAFQRGLKQALVETVKVQSNKLRMIQLSLEAQKVKPVKVWQPAIKKAPEHSYLKRFWYSLISLERLKAY